MPGLKPEREPEPILGYSVECTCAAVCARKIVAWVVAGNRCRWLSCLNPHSYVVSRGDRDFRAALKQSDWLIPDGAGVVLASRLLKGRIRERVTGSDIFREVMHRLERVGWKSVFFLGAAQKTLEEIRAKVNREFPNVRVAGTFSPPFKSQYSESETQAMVDAVNASGADVLWVGMTAPKQEKWIHQNRHRLSVKFAGGIGAVFDFYVGNVKRSHPAFQAMGLEWLPRLIQEPLRLWRRTFVSAPIFLLHVLREMKSEIRNSKF